MSDKATQFIDLYYDEENDEVCLEHGHTLIMTFKKDKLVWYFVFDEKDQGCGEEPLYNSSALFDCLKNLALEYKDSHS